MSSIPLTFNNGQTATTSQISVAVEGGKRLEDVTGITNEGIIRKLKNNPAKKSYLVTVLVKDGVDKNNRPLYERQIRSFDTVNEAKTFKQTVDQDGLNSEAFIKGGAGTIIAKGSTRDGVKTFEYTNNAEDWQKGKRAEKQIKNISRKQVQNIGRDEGSAVNTHTTEFANKKVGETKDDSIDSAVNELKAKVLRSGIGRKKYDNLFYPSFIKKSNQDKLRISILKPKLQVSVQGANNRRDKFQAYKTNAGRTIPYDVPEGSKYFKDRGKVVGYNVAEAFEKEQDRIYARGDNETKPEFDKEIIGSITLPIPNGVTDQNSVNFGGGTLNPAQKFLSNLAFRTILEGVNAGGKEASKAFQKAVKNKDNQKAIAGYVAGTAANLDPNEILSRLDGTIFNNNLALLFKGPTLRPFTFQFTLSPRDRGEAFQVKKIIRALKQSSAVQQTASKTFLAAPNTYGLQFFKGPTPHSFLPNMKECALLNVGVNYMPDNSYMTYEDSSMVSYSLTLSFQELEPIFNNDFENLDNNADQTVGF